MEADVEEQAEKASSKVFAIPELLEGILLNMRIKDLLHAQRVSKTWQTTITGSSKLQQALFFEPVPLDPAKTLSYRDSSRVGLTSWLADLSEKNGNHSRLSIRRRDVVENQFWPGVCVKNPALHGQAIDRPEASWRRMLFSQPPTEAYSFKFREHIVRLGDLQTRQLVKRFFKFKLERMKGWRRVNYASEVHDVLNEKAIELPPEKEIEIVEDGSD